MKRLKYIAIFSALLAGMWSCGEVYEPYIPQGRIEEIGFAKDTFVFNEGAGDVKVEIVASKYVNYAAQIKVEFKNGTAQEDTNFIVYEKDILMKLGSGSVGVELELVDDTIINTNRSFSMSLVSVSGGAIPAAIRQSCVVIITNNDYIPEAMIKFEETRDTIKEDGNYLIVPFHLTMAAEEDVTVTFAQAVGGDQTAKIGEHFSFKDGENSITLPKGSLEGSIRLDVINNDEPAGDVYFDLVVRDVQGALRGDDSICSIRILEDDLDRTLRFGELEEGMFYGEGDGTLEIPMILEGGTSAERMMSGTIFIDSLINCTAEDIVLETTEFLSAGDETIKINVKVKDNTVFGKWGFKLALGALKNVRAINKEMIIDVKDDERILGFDTTRLSVLEGEPIMIPIALNGGSAMKNLAYKIEVVEEGTTAEVGEYSFGQFISIYANTDNTSVQLKTMHNSSKNDVVLKLRVVAVGADSYSPGEILYDESQYCTVVIKNTDNSIGFDKAEIRTWINTAIMIPIDARSTSESINGIVTLRAKAGTTAGVKYTVKVGTNSFSEGDDILVPVNVGITNIEVTFTEVDNSVAKAPIFEMLTASGDLENSDINTNLSSCKITVISGYNKLDMTSVAEVESYNSQSVSEGANLGTAAAMIDGNENTFWHSLWHTTNDFDNRNDPDGKLGLNIPYEVIHKLDKKYVIGKMKMMRRKGNSALKGATVEISNDKVNWTKLFDFTEFPEENSNSSGELTTDKFVSGQYIRVSPKKGAHPGIAELYLWVLTGAF